MFVAPVNMRVYLAMGHTDMRKAINGLSVLVESRMQLDPFSGSLFVFTNRRRNILKVLYWHRNGFCLWQKRLEKHRFRWPDSIFGSAWNASAWPGFIVLIGTSFLFYYITGHTKVF